MRFILFSFSVLAMVGCASAPTETTANNEGTTCERTYPTGSNIPKVQCYTPEQRKEQQQKADSAIDQIRHAPSPITGLP